VHKTLLLVQIWIRSRSWNEHNTIHVMCKHRSRNAYGTDWSGSVGSRMWEGTKPRKGDFRVSLSLSSRRHIGLQSLLHLQPRELSSHTLTLVRYQGMWIPRKGTPGVLWRESQEWTLRGKEACQRNPVNTWVKQDTYHPIQSPKHFFTL
jgi:hypothetical protein